jgi:hypothetical protein
VDATFGPSRPPPGGRRVDERAARPGRPPTPGVAAARLVAHWQQRLPCAR